MKQKTKQKKKKLNPKVRRKLLSRLLIILLSILLLAALLAASICIRVEVVTVSGTAYSNAQEVKDYVFRTDNDYRLIAIVKNAFTRNRKNPAFQKIGIRFHGFTEVELQAKEQTPAAQAEVNGGEVYCILTESGVIIGSQIAPADGIPEISGIRSEAYPSFTRLTAENGDTLDAGITLLRDLDRNEVSPDRIDYADGCYVLTYGTVRVNFGTTAHLEEKIRQIRSQKDAYEGLSGTLHMEDYDGSDHTSFYFTIE